MEYFAAMTLRRIFRQFALISAAEGIYRFGQLILTAYVARVLGPANYGLVASGQVAANYISVISDGGTSLYGMHNVAKQPKSSIASLRQIVAPIVGARVVVGSTVYLIYAGLSGIFSSSTLYPILLITGLVNVASIFRLDWLLKGVSNSHPLIYINLFSVICSALIILSLVRQQDDVLYASFLHVSTLAFSAIFLTFYIIRKYSGIYSVSFNIKFFIKILKESFPYSFSALAQAAVHLIPLFLLGWYQSEEQLGYYNAAYNLVFPLAGIAIYLMNSALPHLSGTQSGEGRKEKLSTLLKIAGITGGLIGGGLALSAPSVIDLVYGPSYGVSVDIVQVLSVALAMQFVRQMLRGLSVTRGLGNSEVKAGLLAALNSLVLGWILVPPLGGTGAAWTVCAGELVAIAIIWLAHLRANDR